MSGHSTLSHEIADSLRSEILRERYRSGDRLPSERELAGRFSASRGAVREALSQLEQLGLIQVTPGGARVQGVEAASIGVLGALMRLNEIPDPALVDQFLQTFGALTSLCAREAVPRASTEQMNRLQKLVVSLIKHPDATDASLDEWREMLDSLWQVADNLVVRLIGNDLEAQFVEQMENLAIQPQLKKKTVTRITNACKQGLATGDAELVADGVQLYFDELRHSVRAAIDDQLARDQRQAV